MKQPIPFGKYYLLERVNVGGMAEVFKAKATGVEGFERLVAVKRILPNIAEDEEFITMFIDEAKIAVQLTHANIAQIFDLGKVSDSFFIALEYIQGKDLRAIFNRCRNQGEPMPVALASYAIMKVCEGLDYAHQKRGSNGHLMNLVHRDVSPQNLIVSYEGEVKVIDFGIAKAAGKAGQTQAGILKGKFGYMSPEQVEGMEIDRRSDVFGLGICLYEMLAGERLFVAETDFATLEKVRKVEIMPPSTYNRRVPEELEQIVLKALAKDREQRYQSAMELHDDLQAFLYSSGGQFGRKDLSAFMHRQFGEEIAREHQVDREYAAMPLVQPDLNPVRAASIPPPPPPPQPGARMSAHPPGAMVSDFPGRDGLPNKSTLLGMPLGELPPVARPVVPPLMPSPQSIPPSTQHHEGAGAGLDMEWDDDELSTQIYDKPEDLAKAMEISTPLDVRAGSLPPALQASDYGLVGAAESGQPAPFTPATGGQAGVQFLRADPTDTIEHHRAGAISRPRGRGQPLWLTMVAVAAILSAIVVGLVVFRGQSSTGTVELSTRPQAAIVTIDGQPVAGKSPFILEDIVPGTAHHIEVTSPGHRSWESQVELRAGQTMALPEVALERIRSGFSIASEPQGARVLVDGQESGEVTPTVLDRVPEGNHVVRLLLNGFEPWTSSTLHVTPGTVLPLPVATLTVLPPEEEPSEEISHAAPRTIHRRPARPRPARSTVPGLSVSQPAVEAMLREHEGQEREEQNEREERPEAVSVQRLTETPEAPENDGQEDDGQEDHEPVAAVGTESDPETTTVATGYLRINSRPWSTVSVDGREIGPTPQMRIEVSAGTHKVVLVNDEFQLRKSITIDVPAGETVTKVLNLTE